MQQAPETKKASKFTLERVEEITSPIDTNTEKWFSYIIGRGTSMITGKKPGTLRTVTEHAEGIVEDLNSRANRHGSMYVARRTK